MFTPMLVGHRRVPASRCEGGDLDKKYAPKKTKCPLMAPQGLHVYSTEHQVAPVGNVKFHVTQEKVRGQKSHGFASILTCSLGG